LRPGGKCRDTSCQPVHALCRYQQAQAGLHGSRGGEMAERLYEELASALRAEGFTVKTGVFGAMMEVCSINDGPVTIIIDSENR
jgi:D-Tyr-tRNAtyr deacylase